MAREQLRADVVIVGGGTIGLCTAYYLHRAGIRPIVVERKRPGAGSSLRNAGYVSPSHFIPLASPGIVARGLRWMLSSTSPFYIKPRAEADLIRWGLLFWRSATRKHVRNSMRLLFDLCMRSLRLYEELAARHGLTFDLEERGIVNLFRSERGKAAAEEEAALSREIGCRADLLDRGGLQTLQPDVEFRATGGLYFPGDSHIDPEKFMTAMTERLTAEGVQILTDEEVTGISSSSPAAVMTRDKEISADTIVIAGGAWSTGIARMLGLRLLVQAGKGYSVTIPRPLHCPTVPMILTESRVALTPFAQVFRLGGTMELAGVDTSITARRVQAIIDAVPLYLGNVDVSPARTETPWAGLRPVTPDGLPFLGRLKKHPGIIVATGHAMIGVTLAPVTGTLVTELLTTGSTSVPIDALDPGRFH